MKEGKFAEAIPLLDEALRQEPGHALALNARGFCQLRLRQIDAAIADFTAAIQINPGYANAFLNRSAARRLAGDAAGAKADYAASLANTPAAAAPVTSARP
jgi:tetratricopeptide (TPR) repeat protein